MKYRLLLISLQFFAIAVSAQEVTRPVHLKSGRLSLSKNLRNEFNLSEPLKGAHYKNRFYTLIQFTQLPSQTERQALAAEGIVLYDYIPDNTFLAEVNDQLTGDHLKKPIIRGLYTLNANNKISPAALKRAQESIPDPNEFIAVSFYGNIDKATVAAELKQAGAQIINTKLQPAHAVFINASAGAIQQIAALPFVAYISSQHMKPVAINYNNHEAHSVNALASPASRNLQGTNVTVGIGDDGDANTHIDFSGRLIDRNPAAPATHGTHTMGTVAGAGIINPRYKGMAPNATIVGQYFSDILVNAPYYVADYGMVLTNNSYHAVANGCTGEGDYDVLSNYIDAQLNSDHVMLHVFAAGNDGGYTCLPFPTSFATVKSGFQCAKNILTVGAIDNSSNAIAGFSSRGPVYDGRLKPEIVAGGTGIGSTLPNNTYGNGSGTSMSSPTVTGTLALLYERYRQLHGGANPSAALIKAVACNGATDFGNPGPDYTFGFGSLNARTAVEALENNTYFTGTIGNGGTASFTINAVPAGTAQVKIMLYWNDPAAVPYSTTTLVNNLDLTVTAPNASVHHPLILNPATANVNDVAIEGIDTLNNIEQVVINNPPAGNFTVTVSGAHIPQGPQDFVVAYEVLSTGVTLESPFGGENWVPGEMEYIRWTATDPNTNPFTIEVSYNNGASWATIANNVPATSRLYLWPVPATATNTGLIRISRNGTSYSDVNHYTFMILNKPVLTLSNACTGYVRLTWNQVTAATSYDIFMLKGSSMQKIISVTDTTYLLSGLNKDSAYWLAVAAVNGSVPGRRCNAQTVVPSGGACSSPAFDNDVTIDLLTSPVTGRMYTHSQLGTVSPQVRIKNLGSSATTGTLNISYQVNGNTPVTETVPVSLAAGAGYMYTFTTGYDFSAPGTYTIKTWVNAAGDTQNSNDTLVAVVKQLRNDPVVLNPSYTEGFESAAVQTYNPGTMGFDGLDRCDFTTSTSNGRARSFVNSGIARTGNRAITLDQKAYTGVPSADSLITTFNLSNYSPTDQLRLSFYYKNHGIDFFATGNQVWIRGSENDAWLPIDTLSYSADDFGVYRKAPPVNITDILASAVPAQHISSSFQIKFGEEGYRSANSVVTDGNVDDGVTYDDITITLANNDVAMVRVTAPPQGSLCKLSNVEPITVQVKNYSTGTLTNVPVTYQINNGTLVTETIPSLAPGQVTSYTFTKTADLSVPRQYTINCWVNYSSDSYSVNDTINYTFHTQQLITSFPYLEGFENSDGYWYTGGLSSSWQWGIPAKTIINKAANGSKAWVTSLTGNYNNSELSYLYSPCFDITGLKQPVLSFSHIFKTEDNCDCDFHWVEYSIDGQNWNVLGSAGSGTNWYDNATYIAWKISVPRWQVSSFDIPTVASTIRFRIVILADPGVNYEGIGIDDIHIFDKAPIYNGTNITSGLTQTVNGNNWVHFTSNGRRVASINANGQNLGSTDVKVYINNSSIRNDGFQYYLDRNIVIQPSNPPAEPVTVRYYFLNTEANALINATGCSSCTTIGDAYASGVTQYSNAPAEENGTLNDNRHGTYGFITPARVNVIPYDSGYYAEYQVSNFSEFWINGGDSTQTLPLAQVLDSFAVTKVNNTALLQWTTLHEANISQFNVERSLDGITFGSLGNVSANGNSTTVSRYQFTDAQMALGLNYYRITMTDKSGGVIYSPVRKIYYFKNDYTIGPNPVSKGILYIYTVSNCIRIELRDAAGRLIMATSAQGNQNQLPLYQVAKGVYFVTIYTESGKKVEKVIVE